MPVSPDATAIAHGIFDALRKHCDQPDRFDELASELLDVNIRYPAHHGKDRKLPSDHILFMRMMSMSARLMAQAYGIKFDDSNLCYMPMDGLLPGDFRKDVLFFNMYPGYAPLHVSGMLLKDGSGFTSYGLDVPRDVARDFSFANLVLYSDRRHLTGELGGGLKFPAVQENLLPPALGVFREMASQLATPFSTANRYQLYMPFLPERGLNRDNDGTLRETPVSFARYALQHDGSAVRQGIAGYTGKMGAPCADMRAILVQVLENHITGVVKNRLHEPFIDAFESQYMERSKPERSPTEVLTENTSRPHAAQMIL